MKDSNNITPRSFKIEGCSEQLVYLDEVLLVCAHLGKLLQGIPKEQRKLTVARLLNESGNYAKDGLPLGEMMIGMVADSWQDFSQ